MVPISGLLTSQQIATMMADSGAATVFVSSGNRALVEAAQLPASVRRIAIGFTGEGWGSGRRAAGRRARQRPRRAHAPGRPLQHHLQHRAPRACPRTSAAEPRRANAFRVVQMRWNSAWRAQSAALVTTALYSYGTMFMVLPPLLLGGTVVIMEQFSPAGALALIEQHKVTHAFMVPTHASSRSMIPREAGMTCPSLRCPLSAGSIAAA